MSVEQTLTSAPTPEVLSRPLRLLIDGEWVEGTGEPLSVVDPSTGEALVESASAGQEDVDRAVAGARRAFDEGPWPAMAPAERAKLLWKLGEAVEAAADELAMLETLNTGKPLGIAKMFEVRGAAESFRYNAGWATKLNGETREVSLPGDWHAYTLREPVGVVGLIVPWNSPLAITAAKLAPALAAGCTVVLKPAELTPLTAVRLGELALEAGFPPGVLNIVQGLGAVAGQRIADHPQVDKISFTGSTAVGKHLLASCAGNLKRVSLELGGKSPVVIYPDADLERAVEGAAMSIFGNTGQVCAAGSRLYVHETVADEVLAGIAAKAQSLRIGPGLDPQTQLGPVISEQQRNRILGYIESGREQGADVLTGGAAVPGGGFFLQPTVLANTTHEMTVVREEIFGPVLSAATFSDDETVTAVVRRANDTIYGLSSTIWTRDIARAHQFARRIKAGNVRVNAAGGMDANMPFGGFKQSGWGKENGREGVEAYTEIKSVAMNISGA
ncbi:aldehyde dehydrogenase family protein [Arthrobacter mobilis]|uniref:Aldehyde dehydrogenase family protein n=1 Tax=Arthrobacter mobilis TaxID=2724944 RepID=A0A7X6K5S9_9MICC|nr:aldehyde dehydrogenase family protein [Arthrobacter mobilis]NKX54215.1 aldehyde dehydrogenase family protein [Arthrobacter mobilis]